MNRDQKATAIAEIASQIDESDAIFAVDYRGITVAQVAELRAKLRESDASFKVVKNSLTERAADQVGAESLKDYLTGPTALTFVRGDVATAAKTVAEYARLTQLLPFKGGLMGDDTLDVEQIRSLSRLPSREVLYGQLVGVVASPISGLVRTLGALVGGLAVALGQVQVKKESGEIPSGSAPASDDSSAAVAAAESSPAEADTGEAETPAADAEPAVEAEAAPEAEAEAPAEEPAAEAEPAAEETPTADAEPAAEEELPDEIALAGDAAVEAPIEDKTEPEPSVTEDKQDAPAQADDKNADVSAESQPEDAETNPTKED
jgi:large subunit ribosomal protein L10